MPIYNLIIQSIENADPTLFSDLLAEDYVMVSHQSNKEISKSEWAQTVSLMYKSIEEGQMSFTNNRCLYENPEVLLMHQVAHFPDGTNQAVLVAHFLKDGKIIKTETGTTDIK